MAFTKHEAPTSSYIRIGEIDSYYEVFDPLDPDPLDPDGWEAEAYQYTVDIVESIEPSTKGNRYVVFGSGMMFLLDDLKELVKVAEKGFDK